VDKAKKKAEEKAAKEEEKEVKPKRCYESDECWDARYSDYLNKDKDMIKEVTKAD